MVEQNGSLIAFGVEYFDEKTRVGGVWRAGLCWLVGCFVELLTLPFSCTFVSRTE